MCGQERARTVVRHHLRAPDPSPAPSTMAPSWTKRGHDLQPDGARSVVGEAPDARQVPRCGPAPAGAVRGVPARSSATSRPRQVVGRATRSRPRGAERWSSSPGGPRGGRSMSTSSLHLARYGHRPTRPIRCSSPESSRDDHDVDPCASRAAVGRPPHLLPPRHVDVERSRAPTTRAIARHSTRVTRRARGSALPSRSPYQAAGRRPDSRLPSLRHGRAHPARGAGAGRPRRGSSSSTSGSATCRA